MSLRLFAAIPIPEEIADRLLSLEVDMPGASWRDAEQFHLTLRFFGEIDEALARDLDHELGLIEQAPFEIVLTGAGSFGGKEPSALWAGVEAPPDLTRLAAACERAARRTGLDPEPRKYRPHVTLAYLHGATDHDAAQFQEFAASFRTDPFWADRFFLYSSRQSKHGSRYEVEAEYPLIAAPA